MGLFGLGKKKEERKPMMSMSNTGSSILEMPSLPEFPSLDEDEEISAFPKYRSSVADIKKEVSKGTEDDIVIPVRNKDMSERKMAGSSAISSDSMQESMPKKFLMGDEKPLFVKIDSYRQAMHTLDALKVKLDEAEEVLKVFEEIRAQEEEKLDNWKKDLRNMKDKLFSIDKELFEV